MKKYSKIGFVRLFTKVVFVAIVSIVFMGFETLTARVNLSHTNSNGWFSNPMRTAYPAGDNTSGYAISYSGNSECLSWDDGPKCTAVPTVTTLDATSITGTGATLNGIVNPNSGPTSYRFHWGTTTSYGYTTPTKSAGSGSSDVVVFSTITGLTPGTTYHFKLVATNALGTGNGSDMTFIAGTEIITTPVTSITAVSAMSGGNIISNGGSEITARGVCWSQTPFPTTTDPHTADGAGDGVYSSNITGLSYHTLYHVRAYATNSNGTFYGNDLEFTTLICGDFSLPFNEEFSLGTLPFCWSQVDHLGIDQIWQFGTIASQTPNPLLSGNYAFVNSDEYESGSTQNADLLSPVLDFSAYSSILLQFNHFMLSNNGSSGSVWYTINNGSDWTLIQSFAATSAANPDAFNQAVDAVAGHPHVMFKWNYTGTSGSYWAIDDVQITGILIPPSLSVTPSNQEVMPPQGFTDFSVISNTNWTAASDQTWCEITPSGTGNGTITAIYTENSTASQRLANITVTAAGLSPVVVTVTQTAPIISVLPANQDVGYPAGNVVFNVTSNANWIASDNQSWCAVTPSGTGDGTINAAFEINTLLTPRIAEITITVNGLSPVVVTVSQAAAQLSLTVAPANINVQPGASWNWFYITTPIGWSATSDQLWCTVEPSGFGNGYLQASYDQNSTSSTRVANIAVTVAGLSPVVVTVTQAGITGVSEFLLTIQNITQTAPNVFEFDIYLLDVDASEPLELATWQAGINFNTEILNGAVQTAGMTMVIPFSSDLPSNMAPYNVNTIIPGLIRIAGRIPPGSGNGYIVSTVAPGTRLARLRFTNAVPFTENSTPNLEFTSSSALVPLYATYVFKYENNMNTPLPVYPGINAIVIGNPVLNGPPNINVTPGNQTVESPAGNYDFTVNSNAAWVAQSDQSWLSVTGSGYGNGAITATFSENTSEMRTANITVIVPGLPDDSVTITQEAPARLLNLYLLLEGLYAGNGTMTQARDASGPHFEAGITDRITVELHNSSDYSIVEHSVSNVELSTTGEATINVPHVFNGSYYITIKHRNSIETTSADPVVFDAPVVSYAFDSQDKAYGNNLLLKDMHYLVKSGDVNQDGSVDTADMTLIENDANGFTTGYVPGDVNGDGFVDTADMTFVDNNSSGFVIAETP